MRVGRKSIALFQSYFVKKVEENFVIVFPRSWSEVMVKNLEPVQRASVSCGTLFSVDTALLADLQDLLSK